MRKNFTQWLVVSIFLSFVSLTYFSDKNVSSNLNTSNGQGINFSPAYPGKIVYTNPDGSRLTIFLKGDEWLHWAKTTDGYTIVQDDSGTYFYAEKDTDGNLVRSEIKANDPSKRNSIEQSFLSSKSKDISYNQKQIQTIKAVKAAVAKSKTTLKAFPTTGTRKVLMILMDFQDLPFTYTKADFEKAMNEVGYNGTGSFKDYYTAMSYNALNLETTVTNIYHASGTMAKYGANVGASKYINPKIFVQEAVDAAEADGIDFSQFDNDGDGICDGIIVVHAGYGEEAGASSNTLWSHKWSLGLFARTYDNTFIDAYNIDPELSGATGSAITNIGVICHEFGHTLGLPDLYDVDYSGAFDAGNWDLMASGSWNNNGITPSSLSIWCKSLLGWSNPTIISSPGTGKTLAASIANNNFYRVNTTTENEYFLLENRQKSSWDTYIPGHGMLIWHIDDNWNATHHAVNDDVNHQGVDVVEADNIKTTATYGGDPFPGTASKTSFTDATSPNSKSWAGKSTWKPISNIAENAEAITFDFMQGMPAVDAAITDIIAPAGNACGLTSTETITINIKNNGASAITAGTITYKINALPVVSETFSTSIAVGATTPISFTTKANLSSSGMYTLTATVAVTSDGITDNNSFIKSITNFPTTSSSLPFSEGFEGTFPPSNWTIINPDNSTTWTKAAIAGNGASTSAAKMDCWFYAATGQLDGLVLPKIDLTTAINPTLTFKVAYHVTNVDGLGVYVSTDCGSTFTKVYYKEGLDLQTTTNYDSNNGMTPATSDEWRLETIDLTSFVGSNVLIKFESYNNYGDNIFIDDVAISEPSCVAPSTQVTDFESSAETLTSMTTSWVRGNGAGVMVIYKESDAVDFTPSSGTDYTSQVGNDLGSGNILAYFGTASTINLTGLIAAKTYNFALYEYSASFCYKTPALKGVATTLGAPTLVTRTVTNVDILSASIGAEVTSQGGSAVTERGFVWNTAGNATLADNFIAVGAGVGTFQQSITLNKMATFYVRAYATNSYGTVYGNQLSFTPMGGCDDLIYRSFLGQITSGTYSDLGSNGSTITVADNDDANSSTIDIGFPFKYNCVTYDKFILNTNGFIKLGEYAPSAAALFYTAYNNTTGGVFASTSMDDINIISPFNHDLMAGTGTPEFRIYTQGTTPNRITTIQFKNLKDKSKDGGPTQYDNLEFQIKLYETTNVIEFVYGTFTGSFNASTLKSAAVGLKGFSNGTANILCVTKTENTAWNLATLLDGNYSSSSNGFSFSTSPVPSAGLTYRFRPRFANDIDVKEIYTLGQLPLNLATPHTVKAAIVNEGSTTQTNVNITLSVTGANTFNPTAIVVPSIDPGQMVVVSFADFTPTVIGTNTLTVSTAVDDNTTNNSKVTTQNITTNTFSYALPSSTATSARTGSYVAACKYHINGSAYIHSIDGMVLNNPVMNGKITTAYVFDATGALIGQSNAITIASGNLGTWVNFTINTPPLVTNADYYVGLSCVNSYFAAYQLESTTRTGAYVTIPIGGGQPVEFGNNSRLMFRANAYPSLQTITFNPLPAKTGSDIDFNPGATASSSLAVTYTSSSPTVATILGGMIHIMSAGTATITASQAGDATYAPAASVSQTLTVTPGVYVDPNDLSNVKIYSNSKDIFVEIPVLNGATKMLVYNIIGNQVYNNSNPVQGINRIDENFSAGTYIVKIITGNEVKTQKVVIQN